MNQPAETQGQSAEAQDQAAQVQDLRVDIDGRALVDGVSLRVPPGRITALIGASGSGKTTTGLALLNEYPPGARVTGQVHTPDTLVGYVPQHPATVLNPARPVAALLQDIARTQVSPLPRRARRSEIRRRILRALAQAQLHDGETLLHRYPHQLSGGQQQRVVLAQALLTGARTLIADEPTTGQDAVTKQQIADQLAAVAREGIAVLLLSHDLEVVRALAHDVHVLRAGRIVESGTPEQLWSRPRHSWTRELLTPAASAEPPDDPIAPSTDAGTPAGRTTSGPAAAEAVLQVRSLTARHGRSTVLHTPELLLPPGCSAVVGRSGSGKTTLARCLAGLHRSHDGEVLLDGVALPRSLRDRTREQLAAVQYVFQDARAAFDEHRPVLGQVMRSAIRLRRVPRPEALAEAELTLSTLGLSGDLVRRRPAELSGGELQRAALARALLARPRVLICDEITSGQDSVTRRNLRTLLADLVRTHPEMSLVLITHDRDTATLATRIAVLDDGHLVEQGPTGQLLTTPRHPLTAALLQPVPEVRATSLQ
ncbi:ATP-binding cassette domain-containing protein [Streptomyces sp. Je 1-4]|uniref:ABC transporter ATP-binding protein n=1 Tax=Streptomyces TaxID=1883 RepID=UPI0021D7F615|nr:MULTISPECIES: ATP-binding cassette domain-containing protein [unclassified Streptomyces]UYB44571.1 ATP-binding cassette domain-containing protein [Streptomyces sp. Je 1-4]UZQ41036.1 ATP-binding cassette domain-containing protein [Streptomyces sp. Je 1-4] [Streptomyces sp. Je 1-4 4N24]UZQ48453.1 ATP-binding cassette domain-containing protein [Streptomyces sp. Je 1-4] [Streptomyces sp. Je 1-4 4N24_ara]